jgi:intracellular sulfur oxidation DsrE/DsrF family protein
MIYNFEFVGGINNSFTIVTKSDVIYEIKFKPSNYLLVEDNLENELVFEFVIEVLYKPENVALTLDKYIGTTINQIFHEFYNFFNESVTVYICDSSDGRQFVRKRKFDNWFEEFNNNSFIKVDDIVLDSEQNSYPVSFILKKDNPKFHTILNILTKTVSTTNENKNS